MFHYQKLHQLLKTSNNIDFNDRVSNSDLKKFQIFNFNNSSLPKMILEYHNDSVNSVVFTKTQKGILVSGGSDKCIIIWKIVTESFTSEKMKILKNPSEVNDLCIYPNDNFIFAGCIDNNIYLWKSNFLSNSFENVKCISLHNNYITSLCLDPNIDPSSQTGKFVSYSDEGMLIISELVTEQNGNIGIKVIKDYKEFINVKNKITSIQKKIE